MDTSHPSFPPGVLDFARRAHHNLMIARDAIIASRIMQTHHANRHRRRDDDINPDTLVYVSTENLSLPKARAKKLLPKFLGPYRVLAHHPEASSYTLDLPQELKQRRIYPTFHVSKLRPHEPNDDTLFPHRETQHPFDMGAPDDQEWLVDEILAHRWDDTTVSFLVKWNYGDSTWEPLAHCHALAALDDYLALLGVGSVESLPKHLSASP